MPKRKAFLILYHFHQMAMKIFLSQTSQSLKWLVLVTLLRSVGWIYISTHAKFFLILERKKIKIIFNNHSL